MFTGHMQCYHHWLSGSVCQLLTQNIDEAGPWMLMMSDRLHGYCYQGLIAQPDSLGMLIQIYILTIDKHEKLSQI